MKITIEQILVDQRHVCEKSDISPAFLNEDDLIVITQKVYDPDVPVIGMRYSRDGIMSGWWIVPFDNNLYSKDDLIPVHPLHLYESRPDVHHFMALPAGYRFDTTNNSKWFDESLLE